MSVSERKILLVGSHSFLAQSVLRKLSSEYSFVTVRALRHAEPVDWSEVTPQTTVVNFALHPSLMRGEYNRELDLDIALAEKAAQRGAHYLMISTRKVYGISNVMQINELHPILAKDQYGSNRAITEEALREILGERLTILRSSNIFGFEPGRKTFFGLALTNLRDKGEITFDVSPFTRRDFLHVDDFATAVARVLLSSPNGTFNLGSGRAIEIGRIALAIIAGYGRGALRIIDPAERDAFELECTALKDQIEDWTLGVNVLEQCRLIGASLADA